MTSASAAASRLEALRSANPEWCTWLALLDVAVGALSDPVWRRAVPDAPCAKGDGTPLLGETLLTVDRRAVSDFVARLMSAATDSPAGNLSVIAEKTEVTDLLEAAVRCDYPRLAVLAAAAGAEPAALHAVAPLLVLPILQSCARSWLLCVPSDWDRGYCPVCGAWPALAEARGLEGSRRLRCGGCGSDWGAAWLRCPFCGTDDHNRLGALVSEATGPTRKLDVCFSCHGYVKTLTVLKPTPARDIPIADLETVDLDLAALAHGFSRPSEPGYRLRTTVVPRRRVGRDVFDVLRLRR